MHKIGTVITKINGSKLDSTVSLIRDQRTKQYSLAITIPGNLHREHPLGTKDGLALLDPKVTKGCLEIFGGGR